MAQKAPFFFLTCCQTIERRLLDDAFVQSVAPINSSRNFCHGSVDSSLSISTTTHARARVCLCVCVRIGTPNKAVVIYRKFATERIG